MKDTKVVERTLEDVESVGKLNDILDQMVKLEEEGMTDELKKQRSKVLFPQTHTTEHEIKGKTRVFQPLTIKWARKVAARLQTTPQQLIDAMESSESVSLDEDMLEKLRDVSSTISEAHGWNDLVEAIKEEDITTKDMQLIAHTQLLIQGTNDFLLNTLQLLIRHQQLAEMTILKMNKYRSTLVTQDS